MEKVQVLDSTGTMVLDTETISIFTNGVYLIWNISGNVQIKVTNMTQRKRRDQRSVLLSRGG